MHANDFRDDLPVTRGQWEQLARGFCRFVDEPAPQTRLAATELLLRLQGSATPAQASGTPQRPPSVAESPASAPDRIGPIRIGGRRAGNGGGSRP